MADMKPGTEFQNWQNLPSITETLAGGKSPLLNILGMLIAPGASGDAGSGGSAMGSGISVPEVAGGIGIKPPTMDAAPAFGGEPTLKPKNPIFGGISPYNVQPGLSLPQLGQANPLPTFNDASKVNSFWGTQS